MEAVHGVTVTLEWLDVDGPELTDEDSWPPDYHVGWVQWDESKATEHSQAGSCSRHGSIWSNNLQICL